MATSSIPVDLLNPGQVFACLGLMEIAEVIHGSVRAGFDWSDPASPYFRLSVEAADVDPISESLDFVAEAHVRSLAPSNVDETTERRGVPTAIVEAGGAFPTPPPDKPAALPALLSARGHRVSVSSWGDNSQARDRQGRRFVATGRDRVKLWSGMAGYPGAALVRNALDSARPKMRSARDDPFAVSAPQSSSLRFDWRADYVAIDSGFSLDKHARIQARGYPLVNVLAAIGLEHARPRRNHKLEYRYGITGRAAEVKEVEAALLPAVAVRAALGCADLPFPRRTFTMTLAPPGPQSKDRCITTVHEETT